MPAAPRARQIEPIVPRSRPRSEGCGRRAGSRSARSRRSTGGPISSDPNPMPASRASRRCRSRSGSRRSKARRRRRGRPGRIEVAMGQGASAASGHRRPRDLLVEIVAAGPVAGEAGVVSRAQGGPRARLPVDVRDPHGRPALPGGEQRSRHAPGRARDRRAEKLLPLHGQPARGPQRAPRAAHVGSVRGPSTSPMPEGRDEVHVGEARSQSESASEARRAGSKPSPVER